VTGTDKQLEDSNVVTLPMMSNSTIFGRMDLNIETGEFTGRMSTEWVEFMAQNMQLIDVSFVGRAIPRVTNIDSWMAFKARFEAYIAMEEERLKNWTGASQKEVLTIEEAISNAEKRWPAESEQGPTT
jgi:hypothetical protein